MRKIKQRIKLSNEYGIYLHSRSARDGVGPGMRCAAMGYSCVVRYRLALLGLL